MIDKLKYELIETAVKPEIRCSTVLTLHNLPTIQLSYTSNKLLSDTQTTDTITLLLLKISEIETLNT